MSKYLIVANWKMNPENSKEAKKLFEAVKRRIKTVKNTEVVICPPFVYLPFFKGLILGAQNVFYKDKGAFTGEVSPLMLKDLKVEYVIVGHSEVRKNAGENDEVINKKIHECFHEKLKPILCVGENTGEDIPTVLEKQVVEGLKNISRDNIKNMVIAYEPVWAIGTGKNCSVDQAMSSFLLIRKIISKLYSRELAGNIRIIYGGSVDSRNSGSYIKQAGAGGLLVGGASLNAKEFIEIVKSVSL
jgi:triosephosphate isomerase